MPGAPAGEDASFFSGKSATIHSVVREFIFYLRDHANDPFFWKPYEIQPALRMIARDKNIIKKVQVILLRDASALLALLNIELPLAAIPPIPSPLGL